MKSKGRPEYAAASGSDKDKAAAANAFARLSNFIKAARKASAIEAGVDKDLMNKIGGLRSYAKDHTRARQIRKEGVNFTVHTPYFIDTVVTKSRSWP